MLIEVHLLLRQSLFCKYDTRPFQELILLIRWHLDLLHFAGRLLLGQQVEGIAVAHNLFAFKIIFYIKIMDDVGVLDPKRGIMNAYRCGLLIQPLLPDFGNGCIGFLSGYWLVFEDDQLQEASEAILLLINCSHDEV
jgi:hypothetical protein